MMTFSVTGYTGGSMENYSAVENFIRKNGYCESFLNEKFYKYNFSKSILHYTKFSLCKFAHSNLNFCDMWNSIFTNCNLSHSSINNTNLENTIFTSNNLYKCSLIDCEINNAKFYMNTILNTSFRNSHLIDIDFSSNHLNYVDFKNTKFENVSGFTDSKTWLNDNCYRTKNGYIVYTLFSTKGKYKDNKLSNNVYIYKDTNKDRKVNCSYGINIFPTKREIYKNYTCDGFYNVLYECLLKTSDIDNVIVPYGFIDYVRCNRVKILSHKPLKETYDWCYNK